MWSFCKVSCFDCLVKVPALPCGGSRFHCGSWQHVKVIGEYVAPVRLCMKTCSAESHQEALYLYLQPFFDFRFSNLYCIKKLDEFEYLLSQAQVTFSIEMRNKIYLSSKIYRHALALLHI